MRTKRMNKKLGEIIETIKNLQDDIIRNYKAEVIGIFGSFVRREQRPDSDIDILVKFKRGATLIHFVGLSIFLEEKLGIKVDVVPYDTVRDEIKEQVYREAIYL